MTQHKTAPARGEHQARDLVVEGNTEFALDLYGKLKQAEGNLFFSPYSLSTALAMTYGGARSDTAVQMARTLHFYLEADLLHAPLAEVQAQLNALQTSGAVLLAVANALWTQQGLDLLKDYLDLTRRYYGASIQPVDFRQEEAARQKINAWVEEQTAGRIKDLIPAGALQPLTRLVLTNAIYFKGRWANPFAETHTAEAPFWLSRDKRVAVPMMAQEWRYRLTETGSLQALELPYAGKECSMVVLLPRQRDGLEKLETNLTAENLNQWLSAAIETKVQVFLPRFRTSSQFSLGDTLKAMGMVDAFGDAADFSGMDGSKKLRIGAVIHQAYVDVNEEGTEAAAATAIMMVTKAAMIPTPMFRADHPFVFLIRDRRTGSILFLGRVVDPTA